MHYQKKNKIYDYRVNFLNNSKIIGIEITCCGRHIGEIRFKDGESKKCPFCGTQHALRLQYNHFHICRSRPDTMEAKPMQNEKKAL